MYSFNKLEYLYGNSAPALIGYHFISIYFTAFTLKRYQYEPIQGSTPLYYVRASKMAVQHRTNWLIRMKTQNWCKVTL